MDRIDALRAADRIARSLRRMGLSRISETGRDVTRWLVGDRVEIDWRGLRLAGRFQHRRYLAELRDNLREAYMLELFADHIQPGAIVLDIGAYIGAYAVLAGQRIGSTGKVVAFEPDPRSFAALACNVHANRLDGIVTTIQAACGETSGEATFWLNSGDGSASSLVRPYRDAHVVTAKVMRLDEALPTLRPSVIKIDAEGAELGILRGMRRVIDRSAQVVIFCECNPSALDAAGTDPRELLQEFGALGFRAAVIDETARRLCDPDEVKWETVKYANVLCERVPR